jgi:hypothetical protein
MLNFLSNTNFDHYGALGLTISVIGVTCYVISNYSHFDNVFRMRQVDTTRVHEGLPTDVAITPEDFRDNPELAEIFDVTDTNSNLNIALESDAHFQAVQNQVVPEDYDHLTTLSQILEAFFSYFN